MSDPAAATAVKSRFAERRRKYNYGWLAMLVLLVALLVLENVTLDRSVGLGAVVAVVALMLADFWYVFRVWRCPACNRFLGGRDTAYGPLQKLEACPKCSVRFV